MVTLDCGRVKPDDVVTIKLVLDALTFIGPNQYSIIINNLSAEVLTLLHESTHVRHELHELFITSMRVGTRSIFYVPKYQNLVDQSNKWTQLSPELLAFIENAPEIEISPDSVHTINYNGFEKIMEELRLEIQHLREDNTALRRALKQALQEREDLQLEKLMFPATSIKPKKQNELTDKIQKLHNKNAVLKQAAVEQKVTIGKLNFKLQEQTEEMQELRKDNSRLQQTTAEHQATVDELRWRLQEKKEAVSTLENDNATLRRAIKELEAAINKGSPSKLASEA